MIFGTRLKPINTPRPEPLLNTIKEGITVVFKNGNKVIFENSVWVNLDEILHLSFDRAEFNVIYPKENIVIINRKVNG